MSAARPDDTTRRLKDGYTGSPCKLNEMMIVCEEVSPHANSMQLVSKKIRRAD
jgi:hypothetical protein